MRTNSLLATVLVVLPLSGACQNLNPNATPIEANAPSDSTREEYAIYKLAIEDVCQPVESMDVLNVTVANHLHDATSELPYKFVRDGAKAARKETLDNYWDKNQESKPLEFRLDLVHGNTYVTEAQAQRDTAYPGYVELSQIGFDATHTQALVYCAHVWTLSGSEGRAYYLLLDKTASGWTISNKLTTRLGAAPN